MYKLLKQSLLAVWVVCYVILLPQEVLAFDAYGIAVDNFCASKPYQGNCALCHVNNRATITQAMREYRNNNLCYFCPTDASCTANTTCTDADGDGYAIEGGSCGPIDCDDNNANINPGATEICTDNIDNNCNGKVDAADAACRTANGGSQGTGGRGKRRGDDNEEDDDDDDSKKRGSRGRGD